MMYWKRYMKVMILKEFRMNWLCLRKYIQMTLDWMRNITQVIWKKVILILLLLNLIGKMKLGVEKKNWWHAKKQNHQWKGNIPQGKKRIKILSYSKINELKLMKQQKRISWVTIQRNTSKEGKTLMKQQKRISRLKIQTNTSKEGKTLMK